LSRGVFKSMLFGVMLMAIFSSSCRKKKKKLESENSLATSTTVTSTGSGTGKWIPLPLSSQPFYTTKAKIKFEDSTMSIQVNASFRSIKGQAIWGSVTYALGIEVARLLIRQDSAFIWDKFNGRLIKADYPSFANSYGAPASLDVLQDLVLTGKVSWLSEMEEQKNSIGDTLKLAAISNGIDHRTWLIGKKVFSQWVNLLPVGPLLQVTNTDFRDINGLPFAYKKTIDFFKQGKLSKPAIKLVFEHSKYDFPTEKPDMPFDYPPDIKIEQFE